MSKWEVGLDTKGIFILFYFWLSEPLYFKCLEAMDLGPDMLVKYQQQINQFFKIPRVKFPLKRFSQSIRLSTFLMSIDLNTRKSRQQHLV